MNSNGHKHDIRSSRTRSYPSSRDKVRDAKPRDLDDDAEAFRSNTWSTTHWPFESKSNLLAPCSVGRALCLGPYKLWHSVWAGVIPDLGHHPKPQLLHEAMVRELKWPRT